MANLYRLGEAPGPSSSLVAADLSSLGAALDDKRKAYAAAPDPLALKSDPSPVSNWNFFNQMGGGAGASFGGVDAVAPSALTPGIAVDPTQFVLHLVAGFLAFIQGVRGEVQAILSRSPFTNADRDDLKAWSERISMARGDFWASVAPFIGAAAPFELERRGDTAAVAVRNAWDYSGQIRGWLDGMYNSGNIYVTGLPTDVLRGDSVLDSAVSVALQVGSDVVQVAGRTESAIVSRPVESGILVLVAIAIVGYFVMRR